MSRTSTVPGSAKWFAPTPPFRARGSLKLLNLTKRITDLLSITKLLTVFETFDSENEAVRSFSASAKV